MNRPPPRTVVHPRPVTLTKVLALLILAGLSGCAAVKSYEREKLGDPLMERREHFAKQSLEEKFFSSREGSIGGASGIGGGCGCAK